MAYCTCDLNQFAYNALTANKDIKEVKFPGTDDIPAQDAYEVSLTRYGETTPLFLLLDSNKIYFGGSLFKMEEDTYRLVSERKKSSKVCKEPEVREYTKVSTEQYESSKKRAWVYVGIGITGVALLMLLTRRCNTRPESTVMSQHPENCEKTLSNNYKFAKGALAHYHDYCTAKKY